MQEKKTLTFVVPAYNMTEYLERCVMSLIAAKRNDDIEVLIVDDGSSDGTLEMAQKFEARYPGIVRAIHQENRGHGGAVNTGIAAARGMYVKVVDADDWVGPESLEQVMAALREEADSTEPIDMLVTNYVYDTDLMRGFHFEDYANVLLSVADLLPLPAIALARGVAAREMPVLPLRFLAMLLTVLLAVLAKVRAAGVAAGASWFSRHACRLLSDNRKAPKGLLL